MLKPRLAEDRTTHFVWSGVWTPEETRSLPAWRAYVNRCRTRGQLLIQVFEAPGVKPVVEVYPFESFPQRAMQFAAGSLELVSMVWRTHGIAKTLYLSPLLVYGQAKSKADVERLASTLTRLPAPNFEPCPPGTTAPAYPPPGRLQLMAG